MALAKFVGLQNETKPSMHLMINSKRMMLEFDVDLSLNDQESENKQRVTSEEVLQMVKIELLNIEI